ncbi:hypothetical protein [Streptomyces sp. NPDC057682]|uniref:hypothetical protein n=1 Tax=Streptomyces sp. NPDC057682 TaxID=3346210 RepID=UPI00367EC9AA
MNNTARNRMKANSALAAIAILAGALTYQAPAASATEAPQAPTAQEYLAYLDGQNDPEADSIATQFKALSAINQQQFLGYLVDPEVLKATVGETGGTESDPVARRTLKGGDVVVQTETVASRSLARGTAADWWCSSTFYSTVFGIKITKFKLEQWYHSTTTKVDKIYNVSASKYNYNPGVVLGHQPEEQWISAAGNALAYVTWEGELTISGLSVSLDKRHHVRCDETGFRAHSLYNL